MVRQPPITSKFSNVNPNGSMPEGQALQVVLVRCCAGFSRIVLGMAPGLSVRFVSTPAGGGGTGRPKILLSRNFPRRTGDVRSGYDVVANSAPCASNPPR